MPTILYANTINYDFLLKQRPQHLMDILSNRGWKVLWVNQKKEVKLRDKINDNFEIYYDWEVFKKRCPQVDVYFSSWSHRHVDLDQVAHKVCVYDSLDNFQENVAQEHLMINRADILLTTSQPLYDLRVSEHENIHLCRNACFPELGKLEYEVPIDLKPIKANGKPIILFSGALATWCDLDLVELIAKTYNMVVVGTGWGIKKMPDGVIYLGSKKYTELQAYYHHCDVNILPFRRCQISDYSNPIKNYEAMAHGKITVATDIPEARLYPDVVLTSSDRIGFMKNISKALRLKDDVKIKDKCYQYASENSWYQRVDIIENAINDFCKNNDITLG
jgi:glycosyltransferase involved in cell wall biosynthesis